MARRVLLLAFAVVVAVLALALETACAQGPMMHNRHFPYPTVIEQGCALCRGTGNCSQAVSNNSSGVYCGELVTTFQPCCCQYRNECMTTIFSERCECLTEEEVEEFMSARFTIFCIFTVLFWIVLIWDRMCGRPYKVMNSNRHHALANSPSVARLIGGAAPRESARDHDDNDDAAAIEAALDEQADEAPIERRDQSRRTSQGDEVDSDAVVLTLGGDDEHNEDDASRAPRAATGVGSIQSV